MNDMNAISENLKQLGYITLLLHNQNSNILLFNKKSKNAEIIFGISQAKKEEILYIGNIMIDFKKRPVLAYNTTLQAESCSLNALIKTVTVIENDINQSDIPDYVNAEMLQQEKFYNPKEIIKKFMHLNHYTKQ